ncbi:diguanylate cyclase (GGDEF) domain-containing protein [Rhizobium mongolense subsp. loessense]|uniref:diguanylate cyclase n=1 Tax=Rhizobium mongolense subsp. loessense TaxID=158890 RepID=A0A1G4P9M2_9HYPH|nr:GGDEF domain-containing protein [Rhizobium mongolense]SCW28916.1 diguanylate cyclase (GGDEF) domain-containing protein [Rhizobium mongolense subsp. loessense]
MQTTTRNAMRHTGAPPLTDAQKIAQHMARLSIPGLPRNYELFHEAVAGHNAALASDIAGLGPHPQQAKLDALGLQHRLVSHCGIAAEASGGEAGKVLREAAQRLSEGIRQKRAFSRAAEAFVKSISGNGDQGLASLVSDMEFLAESLASVLLAETELEAKLLADVERIETLEHGISAVQSASVTDALTGLPNRIALTKAIGELYEREAGTASSALIMVDIDDFKQLNEKYGVQAGNKLIKKLAGLFRKSIKKNDLVARTEGDEFGFLFANVGMRDALAIAERLRNSVEDNMVFATSDKGDPGRLTISLGVALSSDAATAAQLQANAHAALLAAQSNRRQPLQAFGR